MLVYSRDSILFEVGKEPLSCIVNVGSRPKVVDADDRKKDYLRFINSFYVLQDDGDLIFRGEVMNQKVGKSVIRDGGALPIDVVPSVVGVSMNVKGNLGRVGIKPI